MRGVFLRRRSNSLLLYSTTNDLASNLTIVIGTGITTVPDEQLECKELKLDAMCDRTFSVYIEYGSSYCYF